MYFLNDTNITVNRRKHKIKRFIVKLISKHESSKPLYFEVINFRLNLITNHFI